MSKTGLYWLIDLSYIKYKSFIPCGKESCPHLLRSNFFEGDMKYIEVVAAIILDAEKVLCVQRGENKFQYISHKYEFPGGKVEPNETGNEAIKREIAEELSMKIEVKSYLMTIEHQYPDFRITMKCFKCTCLSNTVVLTEHIRYQWLPVEELESLDWAAADIPIVQKLIGDGNGTFLG